MTDQHHDQDAAAIEADTGPLADYDTYCASITSSYDSGTTSLGSTVYDYDYENGRRYHAFQRGRYTMPNDESEQERLDMGHNYWHLILRGDLTRCALPKDKPIKILDVGTGTGIWAQDMADAYPNAEIIGADLSPIQATWIAPNCKFEVDDLEQDWAFREPFDHIHCRNMVGAFRDWPRFIKQAWDNLNPGGFLELHETDIARVFSDDNTVTDEHYFRRLLTLMTKAGKQIGIEMDIAPELKGLCEQQGFEVTQQMIRVPFGTWPKEDRLKQLGRWALELFEPGLEAYMLALFTRVLNMELDECRELFKETMKDLKNNKKHPYGKQYIIVCRKPFN